MIKRSLKIAILSSLLLLLYAASSIKPADAAEPKVISVSPKANEPSVPLNTWLSATFDQPLNPVSVNNAAFIVHGEKAGMVPGSVSYDNSTNSILFRPSAAFLPGDCISVTLAKTIQSSNNSSLQNGFEWEFTTKLLQGSSDLASVSFDLGYEPTAIASADFDHDGAADMAIAGVKNAKGYLQLWYYKNGNLQAGAAVELPYPVKPIYVSDLNNDGYSDLLLISYRRTDINPTRRSIFFIYFVQANGSLTTKQSPIEIAGSNTEIRSAAISDLNGDGYPDITVLRRLTNASETKTALIYLNNGNGVFGTSGESGWFWENTGIGSSTECLIARDFNSDGHIDFAATTQGSSSSIYLFLNPGNGLNFPISADMVLQAPKSPSDLESAVSNDFTGDLQPDIGASDFASNQSYFYRYKGKSGSLPQYDPVQIFTAADSSTFMRYGDQDADGDLDWATLGNRDGGFSTLLNNGEGAFLEKKDYAISSPPRMFTAGDFNKDAGLDYAIIDESGKATLLFNEVNGNFPPQRPVLLTPDDNSFFNQQNVSFRWNAPADADGNLLDFSVTITSLDGSDQAPIVYDSRSIPDLFSPRPPVMPGSGTMTLNATLPSEGRYRWEVSAWDGSCYGIGSEIRDLIIDVTPPSNLSIDLPNAVYNGHWFDAPTGAEISTRLTFTEENGDRATLSTVGLGGPYIITDLPSGTNKQVNFAVNPSGSTEGKHDVQATVVDRAGNNNSIASWIGIDRNPPSGTLVHVLTDTSSSERFSINWSGSSDGLGSGLSGLYSVQVSINNGPWTTWLEKKTTVDTFYQGNHSNKYAFEAGAYDRIGHFEGFSNVAEAVVFVDTTADDITPPGKPRNLRANGSNPSAWQPGSDFSIQWDLPFDESGISVSYWKQGSAPTSNQDYGGTAGPQGSVHISLVQEGTVPIYVWLADGKGNSTYQNYASVVLRKDSTAPVVHQVVLEQPAPSYTDNSGQLWYNRNTTSEFSAKATFSEIHSRSAELNTLNLAGIIENSEISSGDHVFTRFVVDASQGNDQVYPLICTIFDSAANQASKTINVGLDGAAPSGSIASATAQSDQVAFRVSWSSGTDGSGSGLSGLYDVHVKIDTQGWTTWLSNVAKRESTFVGLHGHRYQFEAISKDHVGNIESFLGVAETSTEVDTTSDDRIPPAAPINLTAGGSTPYSPWQTIPAFQINWQTPADESGVVRSLWKLGQAPTANFDTTGSGPARGPMTIQMLQEGRQWLYVWLIDKQNNVNYHNYSRVMLRYDAHAPVMHAMEYVNVTPAFVDGENRSWYNQSLVPEITSRIRYTETFPKQMELQQPGLAQNQVMPVLPGNNVTVFFSQTISAAGDGRYTQTAVLQDSAAQTAGLGSLLGLDKTPPTGAVADAPDTSISLSFTVNWSAGQDGSGSGINGEYDVFYQADGGTWIQWRSKLRGLSDVFTLGKQGHRYGFEALSRDNCSNLEAAAHIAETTVFVDTLADDKTPPPAPINLIASGSNPSPWQNQPSFLVQWQTPEDESGVVKSYWKIGTAPVSKYDTTGSGHGSGPLEVAVNKEGSTSLFVWLEDGRGNVSHLNRASVQLRYDVLSPDIVQTKVISTATRYVDTNGRIWFNQFSTKDIQVQIIYTESQTKSVALRRGALGADLIETAPPSGTNVFVNFILPLSAASDGLYTLKSIVTDVAGKTDTTTTLLGLDKTSPAQSLASGPDTSSTEIFAVHWSAGEDLGCGLSGRYRIYVQDGSTAWQVWLNETTETAATYSGKHGHSYGFEAITWDKLGNLEALLGTAETRVAVDTTADDVEPPPPPIRLKAGGANPSPWQKESLFIVTWELPYDESGIKTARYKIGQPPLYNGDYSGTVPAKGPLSVSITQEGTSALYLWLVDNRNNTNFSNYASVLLRYDKTLPRISSFILADPAYGSEWYNQSKSEKAQIKLTYTEIRPDSVIITCEKLGFRSVEKNPAGGQNIEFNTAVPISGATDGGYEVWSAVVDSAGNTQTNSLQLKLDQTPPRRTKTVSPDTSSDLRFAVTWGGGTDSTGVGLSGKYSIHYRENSGTWQNWLIEFVGESAEFPYGKHGSLFSFEAAAWDYLGNREKFNNLPESSTLVDTTADDLSAPPPPISLVADGSSPSPWKKTATYNITWRIPSDESGVSGSFYKLGQAPTGNTDYSGTGDAGGPLSIKATEENGQWLYVWLKDGRGNRNYQNAARVLLRYDKTPPVITAKAFENPEYWPDWFDQVKEKTARLLLSYRERFADELTAKAAAIGLDFTNSNPRSGLDASETIHISIDDKSDGRYTLTVSLTDSAGNSTTVADTLGLDATSPTGSTASAPDTSSTAVFAVSWSSGDDGAGVGISGVYDVHVSIDGSGWSKWRDKIAGRTAPYTGQQGHRYQFEVAAYDFLGHKEPLNGQAEATVLVDTTSNDVIAPAAPKQLTAGGTNPSPWQDTSVFKISWQNPPDVSAIAKSYYKLGSPPANPTDTSGTAHGLPPINVQATSQDGQWLYLWLQDGRGNINFQNWASVLLRWDSTAPAIDSMALANPMYSRRWFNPTIVHETELDVHFREKHPKGVAFSSDPPLTLTGGDLLQNASGLATVKISFPDSSDTTYVLRVAVSDSAGNVMNDSTLLSLDSAAPVGAVVSSPDTTGSGDFSVSWINDPDDGNGSGLSGSYDVKLSIDEGAWELWKTRFRGIQASYPGEAGHRYAFEAAAYDNVGNREILLGQAESVTLVDPNFFDTTAPAAPIKLTANGKNPGAWTNRSQFDINWVNPVDPSGISKSYYKIGSRPLAAEDTTGNASGLSPITVNLQQEGQQYLYLWLADGRGNFDIRNIDSVLLRYDATPPVIDSSWVANAAYQGKWLNPDSNLNATVRLSYSEMRPDTAHLYTGFVQGELISTNLPQGNSQSIDFNLPLGRLADGCYRFSCSLSDSAANVTSDTLLLCIDATAPLDATASSPATSLNSAFTISWAGANQGSDGNGSGLSGRYDLRIRVDQGPWINLDSIIGKLSTTYVGVHGHSYSFEIAAWDQVGNREPFLGQAETTTKVDTAFIDTDAPDAPVQIVVAGSNPSPWQNSQQFDVALEYPIDPSGIARIRYKLGSVPQANADTSGSASPDSLLKVSVSQEYGQTLCIWLVDGKGNVDYRNYASVLLRYDGTKPHLDSLIVLNPVFGENWYNQKKSGKVPLRVYYSEKHPQSINLTHPLLAETKQMTGLAAGEQVWIDTEVKVQNAPDGVYWIRTLVADSAGNTSDPDSFLINLDGTPPVITYQPTATMIGEGQAFEIQAIITDVNRVQNASVQYWPGGSRFKTTLDMTRSNDSSFVATIPANAVNSRGVEYAILANDGLSVNRKPLLSDQPSAFDLRVQVAGSNQRGLIKPETLVHGTEANAYRMLSFPLEITDSSPQAVLEDNLGIYDPKNWKFFYWNTTKNQYDEYPSTGNLMSGRAFWLITSLENISIDTGPGISVRPDEVFVVPLRRGWNDIGMPFNFDVEWQDILLASAADTQKIIGPYTYQGRWLLPPEVTVLKPWEGYSFYTEYDDISLAIPALEARKGLYKQPLPAVFKRASWVVSVEARQDSSMDLANYFGLADGATDTWDYGLDFVEPPAVGQYISLFFPRDQWEMKADRYASDFRPLRKGDNWDFSVESDDAEAEVKLTFKKVKSTNYPLEITLVDKDANISVSLNRDSTYSFRFSQSGVSRNFRIYAGTSEYLEQHQEDLPSAPSDFMLVQNYPNPFNGSTIISYQLPEDTEMSLAIYNLLAQRVKLIYSGRQPQGFYQYHWDARDEGGQDLGTGIYILRLETPAFTSTRKMVFMR